jgi:hypothetical protein
VTPATPMIQVAARFAGGAFEEIASPYGSLAAAECEGAEVRFRFRVAKDEREGARAAAEIVRDELVGFGAVNVKLEEELIVETRARTLDVARAATLADKLAALWRAQGFEPGDRRDALIGKAGQIEEESRAA